MAGDLLVHRGLITDFGAGEDTADYNIGATLSDMSRAFVLYNVTSQAGSGNASGSTSNRNNDDMSLRVELISTTQIRVTRLAAGVNEDVRVAWTVVEYVAHTGGPHEFVVRQRADVTLASPTTSADTTAVTVGSVADCVPILGGFTSTDTGRNWSYAAIETSIIDQGGSTASVRCQRGGTTATTVAHVQLVEFVGSAWTVEEVLHTFTQSGIDNTQTLTSATAAWSTKFVLSTHYQPNTSDGLDESGWTCRAGSTATEVRFQLRPGAGNPTTHRVAAYVVQNSSMSVQHDDSITGTALALPTGAASPQTETYAITPVTDLSQAFMVATADCAGSGTAYPRFAWQYRLTAIALAEVWRSRHGQGGEIALQIVDLSGCATTTMQIAEVLGSVISLEWPGGTGVDATTLDIDNTASTKTVVVDVTWAGSVTSLEVAAGQTDAHSIVVGKRPLMTVTFDADSGEWSWSYTSNQSGFRVEAY